MENWQKYVHSSLYTVVSSYPKKIHSIQAAPYKIPQLQDTQEYKGTIHNENAYILNSVTANATPLSKPRGHKEDNHWLENKVEETIK